MNIHKQTDYPFFVIPLAPDCKIVDPMYQLNPVNFSDLPFYIRPFASKLYIYMASEMAISEDEYAVVNIANQNYVFVRRNKIIDLRIKEIRLNT